MRVSSNKLLQKYAQPTSHDAVTLLSAQNLSDSNFPEPAYDVVMQSLDWAALTQTTTLVNQEALNQLAQVLRYPGTTTCPGGSY